MHLALRTRAEPLWQPSDRPERRRGAGPLELAAALRQSVVAGVEYRALHLRAAMLSPALRQPHHRRLARETVGPALRGLRARLFELPNGDLVALAPSPAATLDGAREALRQLLGPDVPPDAVALLALPTEAAGLLAVVQDSLGLAGESAEPPENAEQPPPLDLARLALIERGLPGTDLTPFVRSRLAARITEDGLSPSPLWEERRLATAPLCAALGVPVEPEAAPDLAARLRRQLDRRLLSALSRPDERRGLPALYLPLATASVADPAFLRLDALLPREARAGITLGFAAADILADPQAFAFARDFARARGYRLALDDAAPQTLVLLSPARLGLDLVQLRWSPGLATLSRTATGLLRQALPPDPARTVLAGADGPAAVAWGWELGLQFFQGRVAEHRPGR